MENRKQFLRDSGMIDPHHKRGRQLSQRNNEIEAPGLGRVQVERDVELQLSRRAVWLALLVIGAFVPIDLFVTGYLLHAGIELAALLLLVLAARLLRSPARLALAQLVGTLAVALTIVVVIFSGRMHDGVLVWLALFPPIPFYLGGVQRGLRLCALFGAIVLGALCVAVLVGGPNAPTWVAMLNAGGALLAATGLSFLYEQSRGDAQQRLAVAANTDPLTGVANRRGFVEGFEVRRRFVERAGAPMSVLVLDLDHLKPINDALGHAAGDLIIQHVASVLQGVIRAQDLLGRMGGDEFALILPDTTLDGALKLAEKLQVTLRGQPAPVPVPVPGTDPGVSVSVGAAESRPPGPINLDHLLTAADEQLYLVKHRQRGGRRGTRLGT